MAIPAQRTPAQKPPAKPEPKGKAQDKPKFNPHAYGNNLKINADNTLTVVGHGDKELSLVEIYKQLAAPFSEDVVERTKSTLTKKGYDTTGIKYQAVVDRFNDVLTPWGWKYKVINIAFTEIKSANGRTMYECEADVAVSVFGQTFEHTGGHTSTTRADAKKGAVTNGLKKTAAMFGNGRQVYLGTLDDDNVPVEEKKDEKAAPVQTTKEGSPTITLEDINGVCWIGRESKGKQWLGLSDSLLTLIANYKSDARASAIATKVISLKGLEAALAILQLEYKNDEKFKKCLDDVMQLFAVKSLPELVLAKDITAQFLGEMKTRNDGLPF